MTEAVVEWAPFKVKPGVTDEDVARACQANQEHFLSHQPGFLRRALIKGQLGVYTDIVWWESEQSAKAAMAIAPNSRACQDYFHIMDLDTSPALEIFSQMRWFQK